MQGINDLVTPFLAVFLAEHFESGQSMETWDLSQLPEERVLEVRGPKTLYPESRSPEPAPI